jgi:hypothetical protein
MQTAADVRFEPGVVLPVQFYPARGMRSEKRLMLAILEDALRIYRKHAHAPDRRHERLAAETKDWLFSDDTEWPLSFVNVCSALGIDVARLRTQLVVWGGRWPTPAATALEARPRKAGTS